VSHRDTYTETGSLPAGLRTEADSIAEVARLAVEPHELQPGSIYAVPTATGVETIDLDQDKYRPIPRRKTGTVQVEDLGSFLAYWKKHADDGSEIYVNVARHTITAVLDASTISQPRWGEHRAVLALKTTDRWNDWTRYDRKDLTQREFAEFIEDHLDDIREPDAATMLEIASTFQAQSKVRFTSNVRLSTGQRTLSWEETTSAQAGEGGKLTVPTEFKITVAPFDFSEVYGITARFRYRMNGGELIVQYLLNDPAAVIRDAVLDVVTQIERALSPEWTEGSEEPPSFTVLRGTPA
jgi:uncharacterized protein YfdQ (DUF2303 family)